MKNPKVSFEFFPAKTPKGETKLLATAEILKAFEPEFFSVTFGAFGSTRDKTFETVTTLIEQTKVNTAPHISCMGSDEQAIKEMLDGYKANNVKRLVVLRGDRPSGMLSNPGPFHYASELVSFIRSHYGDDFYIEVACYPETHPESKRASDDFEHFVQKVNAGADAAITQYFYNPDGYYRLLDKCHQSGIQIPIIPGIMPITNFEKLLQFSKACGAEIPLWLFKELEGFTDDTESLQAFGLDFVSQMCENLLQNGAPSLHFYTLNDAKATMAICQNLSQLSVQNISSSRAIA